MLSLAAVLLGLGPVREKTYAAKCPCDIYQAGGTPCVAAHSTVRALYSSYNGLLYQVRRKSDNATRDIGVLTTGGYADIAAQDSFLAGGKGSIYVIYDQSANANHLTVAPAGGYVKTPDTEANANAARITIGGHPVYGFYQPGGSGYRNDKTRGVVTGNKAEGMYMVASGKHVNDLCCFDYGNAETNNSDNGTGTMECLYLGNFCWFKPCNGTGPWVFADLENGLFTGGPGQNTSVPYDYVTAMLKGSTTRYTIRAGDATKGGLKTMADTTRPAPNKLEGAIILGIGGDNSNTSIGTWFEGAITTGRPPDSTEDSVQANIVAAGYGKTTLPVSARYIANEKAAGPVFKVNYNQSNGTTAIIYALRETRRMNITILDLRGGHIAEIVNGVMVAGSHSAVWNATQVPAGVYVCRLSIDGMNSWTESVLVGK